MTNRYKIAMMDDGNPAPIAGTGYRLLCHGEMVCEGDERLGLVEPDFWTQDHVVPGHIVGKGSHYYRRGEQDVQARR